MTTMTIAQAPTMMRVKKRNLLRALMGLPARLAAANRLSGIASAPETPTVAAPSIRKANAVVRAMGTVGPRP